MPFFLRTLLLQLGYKSILIYTLEMHFRCLKPVLPAMLHKLFFFFWWVTDFPQLLLLRAKQWCNALTMQLLHYAVPRLSLNLLLHYTFPWLSLNLSGFNTNAKVISERKMVFKTAKYAGVGFGLFIYLFFFLWKLYTELAFLFDLRDEKFRRGKRKPK